MCSSDLLFSAEGRVLPAAAGSEVLARYERGETGPSSADVPGGRRGRLVQVDGIAPHVRRVTAIVDVDAIRRHRPRVWLDSCHGAGSRVAVPLLEALGCELVLEGGVPDGRFEHEPEPTAANLAPVLPRIAAGRADVGFFQDPDADRLAIATAAGRYIGEEATLALAVETVLGTLRTRSWRTDRRAGDRVTVAVRATLVALAPGQAGVPGTGRVLRSVFQGASTTHVVDAGGTQITIESFAEDRHADGAAVTMKPLDGAVFALLDD